MMARTGWVQFPGAGKVRGSRESPDVDRSLLHVIGLANSVGSNRIVCIYIKKGCHDYWQEVFCLWVRTMRDGNLSSL